MSITDVLSKIKPFFKQVEEFVLSRDIFILLTIVFVGIASFGLGRLSAQKVGDEPVKIEQVATSSLSASVLGSQSPVVKPESNTSLAEGGIIIGTKSSKKYRFPWCKPLPAESNRITFQSIGQAKQAGYTPVANCKGLQ